jgi:hypothetical protein
MAAHDVGEPGFPYRSFIVPPNQPVVRYPMPFTLRFARRKALMGGCIGYLYPILVAAGRPWLRDQNACNVTL